MTGPAIAVEKLPVAPITASAERPVRGKRSEVIPSIVGHQNAMPTANTPAKKNAAVRLVAWLNRYRPIAATAAVMAIRAVGAILCDTLWPNWRIRYITMLIHTTCRMPAWSGLCVRRLKIVGIQLLAPSSVAAVSHMHTHTMKNSGRSASVNMSPNGTPAACRSVAGKVWPTKSQR